MSELSEKAKSIPTRCNSTRITHRFPDDVDTAVAWAKGEISRAQIEKAVGIPSDKPNIYYGWLLRQLRIGIESGILIVAENRSEKSNA